MKIFVWRAYGDITVYNADNVTTLKYIYESVLANLDGWGFDEDIGFIDAGLSESIKRLSGDNDIPVTYRRAINMLLDLVGIGSHDAFDYGTGFQELQVKF